MEKEQERDRQRNFEYMNKVLLIAPRLSQFGKKPATVFWELADQVLSVCKESKNSPDPSHNTANFHEHNLEAE